MPWENPYPGLSAAEFSDIHEAVAEAMGYVTVEVILYEAKPESKDDLYREGSGGKDGWATYAEIGASVKINPSEEQLTRMGLKTNSEFLVFIPKRYIELWEVEHLKEFSPEEDMEILVQGVRYNIHEAPAPDALPVSEGGLDFIGRVITGWKEQ